METLDALAAIVGPNNCLRGAQDLVPYSNDWFGKFSGTPLAAVRPGSVAEVSFVLRECARAGLGVVPAGGRTGLCGAAVPAQNGPPSIVLSLERLNRIREVDARDFSIVAEAGCIIQQVQEAAAAVERLLPPSLGVRVGAQVAGPRSVHTADVAE